MKRAIIRTTSALRCRRRDISVLSSSHPVARSIQIHHRILPNCIHVKSVRLYSSSATATATVPVDEPATTTTTVFKYDEDDLSRLNQQRNIGISAHIDSGKTTLTERILFYTGRIREIHDVRGKDGVGAKMDSMELEREKGITIQSAATYAKWNAGQAANGNGWSELNGVDAIKGGKEFSINIIDTPGHVDFTIEVERSLRVLDGAILVLCAVGGVQSQTMTVDRQMKRYNVPRICFVNKMDRPGANPVRVVEGLRQKLGLNAALVQIPIGAESEFKGVVDLVRWKAYYNDGAKGETLKEAEVPQELVEAAKEKRTTLIGMLAEVDEEICDLFVMEEEVPTDVLMNAIRRATLARTFCPVFVGSAYHNKSVQPLLDGVCLYLPAPHEVVNNALDQSGDSETAMTLSSSSKEPLVALAFKLEEGRFGQLTYLRVYQGSLKKGGFITNVKTGKRIKVPRLVRMHANEMEDVDEVGSGEICALFGVECSSGDTFTDGTVQISLTSMYVPPSVISLSLVPKKDTPNFSKALNRFQKEDPTFRVHVDSESKETIISGMGELHLDIYVERMKREYGVDCVTGKPRVAFRETITKKIPFNYTHKKQTGGSGQYGRVMGYIEPIEADETDAETSAAESPEMQVDFVDNTVGNNIPSQFVPAIEKGFRELCERGLLIGHPIRGVRMVLEDGLAHAVDSSELAFKLAAQGAFREAFPKANPRILEPVMSVSITAPSEFQGTLVSLMNKRKGTIQDSVVSDQYVEVSGEAPLNEMFGFSTDLRSATQGKGEFSMEYKKHEPVTRDLQETLIQEANGNTGKKK